MTLSEQEKLELFDQLEDQMSFLVASTRLYKAGSIAEAKRLATTIRVLVHDTASSRSLLGQMDVKDKLLWISSGSVDPANLIATFNLAFFNTELGAFVPLAADFIQKVGSLVDFETWWAEPVMKDVTGDKFSRKEIVLALANKEGGAHVDKLQRRMRALAREGSLGLSMGPDADTLSFGGSVETFIPSDGLVVASPLPASAITITTEIYNTLTNQWSILHPDGKDWEPPVREE
ncbi:hypothetical protein LG293_14760 [Citricoccus nitrophenolicus]